MSNVRSFVQRAGSGLWLAGVLVLLAATQMAARSGAVANATSEGGNALMMSSIEPAAEPPAVTVTAVRFRILETCNSGLFNLKINGQTVGTVAAAGNCTCSPGYRDVTLTDAATLTIANAAVNSTCGPTYTIEKTSSGYMETALVDVTTTTGTSTTCIIDRSNRNCAVLDGNLCINHTSTPPETYNGGAVDSDADGICDAIDTDADNDGVLNAADNCPAVANPTQLDTNHDGVGDACSRGVSTVPWSGNRAKPHVVYSGGSLVLQAVASYAGDGVAIPLQSGSWDFGDGSAVQNINVSNSLVLEATHTYTGSVGTPYTATITVTDTNNVTYTDTVKVQIQSNSLDTRVNMAIDRALWYNHKSFNRNGGGATSTANCSSSNATACTSGAVQAFEVNGHRESGEPSRDPFVNDTARGLRFLQTTIRRLSISAQAGGNPDTNGNGYGLEDNGNEPVYIDGQIVDAFVASGTKTKKATVGSEVGRTYLDIVQDLMDAYQFGQNENNQGGWIYNWNDQGGIDSSSSGWWGVAAAAAKVWGIQPAAWVQNLNLTYGIPSLQAFNGTNTGSDGSCSYRQSNGGGNGGTADTAACMIMLAGGDNQPRSNARFTAAEKNLAREFPGASPGNIYAMYNVTKAMRLAVDSTGASTPITLMDGTIDWYGAANGFANTLVNTQDSNGMLAAQSQQWASGNLANSWGILILSPALFEQGPTAVCSVDATSVCQAGAPGGCNTTGTNPYATVHFDGSQSTAGDNPIAANGYSWNFDDGGSTTDANGVTASTSYSTIGTKNATLTVTDTKGNSSAVTCPVSVTSSALPPIVDAGGPYSICIGDPVILTSHSTGRGSNIVSYEWDFKDAINFATIDATGVSTDQTAYFTGLGLGTYDIGLRITDDNQPVNTETTFSTVTIRDCEPPVITVPANITINTNGSSAAATFAVSATDNVDTNVTVSCASSPTAGLSSGSQFPVGTTTMTCNAVDRAGNHAAPKTFTITVANNAAPTAVNDSATTHNAVVINVLANDSDPDGDTLTVAIQSGAAHGSLLVNADNTITYTPFANSTFASDAFSYRIDDGHSHTATASVSITITNAKPTNTDYAVSTHGQTVTVNVLANAADTDGDTVTLQGFCGLAPGIPAHGFCQPGPTAGTINYTPFANWYGPTDQFGFTVRDGRGGTAFNLVTVTYVNELPVPAPHTFTTTVNTQLLLSEALVLVGATDPDGDHLSVPEGVSVTNGTLAEGPVEDSAYYVPTPGFIGVATLSYVVDDNHGGLVPATATITVTAPTTTTISAPDVTYGDNGVITVTVGSDASSAPTGTLSLSIAGGPAQTATLVNGSATFTVNSPAAGDHALTASYAGQDFFLSSVGSGNLHVAKAAPFCSVTSYSVTYDTAAHTATGSCTGVRGESLAGLDLTGTTHTGAGTYTDAWTFTDVTGNYSNTGGSVTDAIAKSPTKTTLAINTDLALAGAPVTLTATVVSVAPGAGIPDGTVTFMEGTTVLGTSTVNGAGVATLTTTTLSNGPHTIKATYNESANFLSSTSNTVDTLIYGFAAGGGTFVISDTNATMGNAVSFWGAQWEKNNVPSGGKSNASFKGFAMTPAVPTVGATFTSAPGNSVPQPSSVPQYLGIIVTSKVTKSGSNITGTIVKLVVVKVDAGYVADPGHAGTGKIVAFIQ